MRKHRNQVDVAIKDNQDWAGLGRASGASTSREKIVIARIKDMIPEFTIKLLSYYFGRVAFRRTNYRNRS